MGAAEEVPHTTVSDGSGLETRSEADVAVVIAGGGPTGLMLAAELQLAGVRPLVLERQSHLSDVPKANGFSGQIVDLLRFRGLLGQIESASIGPVHTAPRLPFGGVHLDFSNLDDPPIWGLHLPQSRLERLLSDHALGLGVQIHRGHEVVSVRQEDGMALADVRGPEGRYEVSARYLVGCDGGRSTVRETAGIPFPGTTYTEVNRLGQVTLPDSVTRLKGGDLEVPGLGRIRTAEFTRTDQGVFGLGWMTDDVLLVQTTEDESVGVVEDRAPMTRTEFEDSIRRVLGADLPLKEVTRLSRYGFQARQAERYRDGRILVAGDAAHQFPATGIGINVGMLDAVNLAWKLAACVNDWAPAALLDTYHHERHFAGERAMLQTQAQMALKRGKDTASEALRELFQELLTDEQPLRRMGELIAGCDIRYSLPSSNRHAMTGTFAPDLALRTDYGISSVAELTQGARPILLDLADRGDIRETARDWRHRIDIHTAETDHRPADALLIRPDAHIAWAATVDESVDTAATGLGEALSRWFGSPSRA